MGVFAHKAARWAFITGVIFYALDTGLVILALLGGGMMPFGLVIHGLALYNIASGIGAAGQLQQIQQQMRMYQTQQQTPTAGPRV